MKKAIIVIIAFLFIFFLGILLLYHNLPTAAGIEDIDIDESSILTLDISKTYPEKVDMDFSFFQQMGKRGVAFHRLIKTIEYAKDDENIKALYLTGTGNALNRAQSEELAIALKEFRDKKPIYGYTEILTMGSSVLFAQADHFYVPPPGMLLINGVSIEPLFYKGLFDKLGVGMDVVMRGDFKGGMENFTRKSFSEPFAETIDMLLDDIMLFYKNRVTDARGITDEDFDKLIEKGLIWGDEMYETGLVDGLLYPNQVDSVLMAKLSEEGDDIDIEDFEDRLLSINKYANFVEAETELLKDGKIALVIAEGSIRSGKGNPSPFGGDDGIYGDKLSATIDEVARDDEIDAIVLRVNSPGGSALASDIIWNSIVRAKAKKPFIVSQAGVAASGGYYISMPADTIFAGEGTVTGSIGVYGGKPYVEGLMDEWGVTKDTFKRGEYSQIYSTITRPWTDAEKALLLRSIDHTYETFVGKAAEGRNRSFAQIDSVAQGHIWTGTRAVENGLVDRIGGLWDAIACAQRMAGNPANEQPEIVTYPKPKTFMDLIETLENVQLPGPLGRAVRMLSDENTAASIDFGQPMLYCPFDVKTDKPTGY